MASKNNFFKSSCTTLPPYEGLRLSQISFPLGGIGTGCVGLSGYGGLRDWEIFNRPNVGGILPYTFPVIYAREPGKAPVCRVLQGPALPPHGGDGMGAPHLNGEGFPHMDACRFRGEYPFAEIEFSSRALPIQVVLEAYNPFIPNDADASGYPAAILKYTVHNPTPGTVDVSLAWSMFNPIGTLGVAETIPGHEELEYGLGQNENLVVCRGGLQGVEFVSHKWPETHPRFGSVALMTPDRGVTVAPYWKRAGWFTPKHDFWDTFSQTGRLPMHTYGPSDEGQSTAGAVGVQARLRPGGSRTITFYITWYFPNFEKYWHRSAGTCCQAEKAKSCKPVWKNQYAHRFTDASDVAAQLHGEEKAPYGRTRAFHDALFNSSLPAPALDAVSSQMSILKTPTVVRLSDGSFYAFEGCTNGWGCCEGSCTHVWNYQQTLPYLFPGLERTMRDNDYTYNMREDGGMCFRLQLPLGSAPDAFHACADGQMGGIMKALRDWRISGDDAWMQRRWPDIQRALEYAWKAWDPDKQGVMTGIQHNTYDIEFLGPNPMMAGFYLGALRAGEEIARQLGDLDKAAEYRAVFESGCKIVESRLFNGEYYIQDYDPEQAPEYQFGTGCLADQMLGQLLALFAGLGPIFKPERIRKTLRSIVKYNWKSTLKDHANAQRVYALGDEAGLVLCTWPKAGRPDIPFPYSDEVWTGIEYQVASHCIIEGLVKEGLAIVEGARSRHDGQRRNPWDEFECGHHYARAMSAYGLLLALSGFQCDLRAGMLGFAPRTSAENFQCFWSVDGAWGVYAQTGATAKLSVLEGALSLKVLILDTFKDYDSAIITLSKTTIRTAVNAAGQVVLPRPVKLSKGGAISIKFNRQRP